MKNRVRVESDEQIVTNAGIFLRGPDNEWVDVRQAVQGVDVKLRVGEVSRASLDVILTEGNLEAVEVDQKTLEAFAATLRLYGWRVSEPEYEDVAS